MSCAVVGIDLGTTTTLLSCFIQKSNAAAVVENSQGMLVSLLDFNYSNL